MMQTREPSETAVTVGVETPAAFPAIRRVSINAFGRPAEANLVDVLRRHGQLAMSWVAETEEEVVGHAVLTPVTVLPRTPELRMLGLGPVAVLPEFQRQGIGSMLIKEAIRQASADGWQAITVVGVPEYFARFGFVPARQVALRCEFRVPAETFLVLELQPETLDGLPRCVRYLPEFSGF
jgi:putative acetyltransferase